MKKTYFAIISAAVLFAFHFSAFAQLPSSYSVNDGIAYSKVCLGPDDEGTYTIYLQSFVLGESSIVNESIPADIVLVLDVSGSMDENITHYQYNARSSQTYSYNGYGYNTYYYKHTDGNYYQVSSGSYRTGGWMFGTDHYYLTFEASGTTFYLSDAAGGVTTTRPSAITNQNTTIWTGVLYTRTATGTETKISALRKAVNAFIDEVQKNDLKKKDGTDRDEPLGNQIAIVKFAADRYCNANGNGMNEPYNYNGQYSDVITPGNHRGAKGNSDYNYTEVLAGFTSTSTNSNTDGTGYLKNRVAAINVGGATASHFGLTKAKYLLESIKNTRTNSSKTVVLFTDGIPGTSGWADSFANGAISVANELKSTYNAKVFTIGVFDNLGDDASNAHNYMNYVSSNYPNAQSMTDGGTGGDKGFYQDASEADLTSIFTTIAQQSGGADIDLSTATVTAVDVVAQSFDLPEGTIASDIKVYTAKCTGEASGYLTFEPEADWAPATGVEVVIGDDEHTITATGFNYSDEWCGKQTVDGVVSYRGHKLIMEIPIQMSPTAVGGPNVATNAEGSGIFVDGVNKAPFVSPHVSLPVNLHIQKQGLKMGESAKFLIQKQWAASDNPPEGIELNKWYDVTTVFVTRKHEGPSNPEVKIRGLDPDYIYKVIEEKWGWSYDLTNIKGGDGVSIGNLSTRSASSEDLITNPFIFVNTPKADIDQKIRHAESKATNNFRGDVTEKVIYEDSKTNTRTSNTSTTTPTE